MRLPLLLRPPTLLLAALAAGSWATTSPLERLTVEAINDPGFLGTVPTVIGWHPDGHRLTYVRPRGDERDIHAFDVARGEETLLLEGGPLDLPGGRGRLHPLNEATWMPDGHRLLVPAADDIYLVDIESRSARALVKTSAAEESPTPSPDGRWVAFTREGNLYVVDATSGREIALTTTGSETLLNGRLDWVYEEELGGRRGQAFAWAPSSQALAYLQLDQSPITPFPIVDYSPAENTVLWQRYPRAGTPNSVVRLGVVAFGPDGAAGPERVVSLGPEDHYIAPQLAWTPDSGHVAAQQIDRAQDRLRLRLLPVPADARAPLGEPRTVLTEESDRFVNLLLPPLFHEGGERFLWLSERDGFAHLYDCDLSGDCGAVTRGEWQVDARVSFSDAGRGQPVSLSEGSAVVHFVATEKDPRERHLYQVRLDGSGLKRLTAEDGTHGVLTSPDGRFYSDMWSDSRTPRRLWVASTDGAERWNLEANHDTPLLRHERGRLEWVQLEATDGSTLYASLLTPPDFDPDRSYPVVASVYGGPHAQTVTRSWRHVSPLEELLASRGFLVWQLDNRGSAGRGVAFESAVYGRLGQVEVEDQLTGIEYLKGLPFVDGSRLGITGWSYGGYLTLRVLTHAPQVFRSGVAGAPVTDWRFYDTIYTERYMGTPADNPRGYEGGSPLAAASRLEAELLLIHGSSDDNVHLANTLAFARALIDADRPHRLVVHPGQKHGFRGQADRIARDRAVVEHFERTLNP